jgi:tetratricopeptide (TPR) repeat protein
MNPIKPFIALHHSSATLAFSALLLLFGLSSLPQQLAINMRSLSVARSLLASPGAGQLAPNWHEMQSEPQLPAAARKRLDRMSEAQAQGVIYSGMLQLAQGNDDGAERDFSQAVECSALKRCNFIHLHLGEIWAQRGLFSQADAQWRFVNAPEYFSSRGAQALAAGQLELSWLYLQNASRPLLEAAVPRMGSELGARLRAGLQHLGASFQSRADYQKAKKSYLLCLQLFPEFVPCRLAASQASVLLGQPEQALAVLEEGVGLVDSVANPQGAALLYLELARLQAEQQGEASAIRTLQAAQAAGLKDAELAVQLGIYLRQAGDLEQAVAQFLSVGESAEPELAHKTQRQLAYTLIQLGQLEEATRLFLALVAEGAGRTDDLITLARLELRLGSTAEACRHYDQAQALSSAPLVPDAELQAKCPTQP